MKTIIIREDLRSEVKRLLITHNAHLNAIKELSIAAEKAQKELWRLLHNEYPETKNVKSATVNIENYEIIYNEIIDKEKL